MAVAGRRAVLQENQDRHHRELQEAIENMNTKQSGLLVTVEEKQTLMNGGSDGFQRKFLMEVLVLEEKTLEVENELHEAREEMKKLMVSPATVRVDSCWAVFAL